MQVPKLLEVVENVNRCKLNEEIEIKKIYSNFMELDLEFCRLHYICRCVHNVIHLRPSALKLTFQNDEAKSRLHYERVDGSMQWE